jgi:putative redox protein
MASVRVERTDDGGFIARNDRGAEVTIGGSGEDGVFTPVELLLAALGGCEIVTIEPLTTKRGHRLTKLAATVEAEKVAPTKIGPITATYDVEFPEGDEKAPKIFTEVAHRVHDNHCTVGRALREGTPSEQVLPGRP